MSLCGLFFPMIERSHVTVCCISRSSAVTLWIALQPDRVLSLCEHFYNQIECCHFMDCSSTWWSAATFCTGPQPDWAMSFCRQLFNHIECFQFVTCSTKHRTKSNPDVWDKNEVKYFCVGSLVQIFIRYVEDGNRLPFRKKYITPSTEVSNMVQIIRI